MISTCLYKDIVNAFLIILFTASKYVVCCNAALENVRDCIADDDNSTNVCDNMVNDDNSTNYTPGQYGHLEQCSVHLQLWDTTLYCAVTALDKQGNR